MRGLAAQAEDLMAIAASRRARTATSIAKAGHADRDAVLGALAAHGRDWLGHTVAFFACQQLGLFEALPLPCVLPARAVLATRPHVRPLLAAIQRCPDYLVAIINHGTPGCCRSAAPGSKPPPANPRRARAATASAGGTGWRPTASSSASSSRAATTTGTSPRSWHGPPTGGHVPLVIGGRHDGIAGLLQELPPAAREAFAGSFTADPHALTPARVRELACLVIEGWVVRREQEPAGEILGSGLAAVGLHASLAAVKRARPADLLVAHEGMIAGFGAARCGAPSTGSDECPAWGTAARAVPDLLEEMVQRTLDDNGPVTMIRDAPFSVAARLRFPVTAGESVTRGDGR